MKTQDTMSCINCGVASEYNRRVEHVETGRIVGGLCESCEQARFGDTLRTLQASESPTCLYCDSRPTYALPEHVVSLDDGGRIECEVSGYFVTPDTPHLCRSHLAVMRPESATFWPERPQTVDVGD